MPPFEEREYRTMRIAICDDEEFFLNYITEQTKALIGPLLAPEQAEIDCFADGSLLMARYEAGSRYDLVLLDWDMPILNGEATGQAIRQLDNDCLIIFITGYAEYALKAFRLTTFRYVLKGRIAEDLPEALRAAFKKQAGSDKRLIVKTEQNSLVQLRIADIYYVEHLARQNILHAHDGLYYSPARTPLVEFEDSLLANGFVKSHKAFLVNIEKIRQVRRSDILLSNGESVPMSRNFQKPVMMAVVEQIKGEFTT
jgi:DNA-binding LytR/AlgR family response regulator